MEETSKAAVLAHIEYQRNQFLKDASTLFYPNTYREACKQIADVIDSGLLQSHADKPVRVAKPQQIQNMMPAQKPASARSFKRFLSS